jgi:hypothetical protein
MKLKVHVRIVYLADHRIQNKFQNHSFNGTRNCREQQYFETLNFITYIVIQSAIKRQIWSLMATAGHERSGDQAKV